MTTFLAGTSGYSYKEWKGSFYPEKLAATKMLAFYAEQLPAVEINSTFYRMPKESVLETWAETVPDGFRFIIKASRRITHLKRLNEVSEEVEYLLDVVKTLGPKLGAILFQLPPTMKKNMERLNTFVDLLPNGCKAAMEFRHESWLDDEVFDCLRAHQLPVCYADMDTDEADPGELPNTGSWGYVRLRRPDYTDAQLKGWADRLRAFGWDRAFVFFKHEDEAAGPRMAQRFLEITN